ncbi:hypothetical protein BDM02DRAFT_3102096, partial [Thelephora ganbajun]
CIGKACKLCQPEATGCTNVGGFGNNVGWKVPDLPSSLRLGQVRVSCEGWSESGDLHILQGERWKYTQCPRIYTLRT